MDAAQLASIGEEVQGLTFDVRFTIEEMCNHLLQVTR